MRSMVLTGLNRIEIVERPLPVIQKPDEVLIKIMSVGICGSDIHYYREGRIGSQVVQYPFTIGHEGSGIITEIGTSVSKLKPGDRIAIDPAMPCFICDQCRSGRMHTCRNLRFLGCPGQSEGCLSEYIVIPASSCFPIDDSLSFDAAALSEPLTIGVYATSISRPVKSMSIGILGAGPIGISVLLPSMHLGARKIYMTDKIDARLELAKVMGAHWTGNPDKNDIVKEILESEPTQLDIVFECCGKQEAADQAMKLLKPGGQLVIIGIPSFDRWHFDADIMRRNEIAIQNVRRQNECLELTLQLMKECKLKPDKMQTHTFSFDQVKEAFETTAEYKDGVMKSMIRF